MNILGAHSGHDTNICFISDGELKYYNKIERLSGIKRDNNPPDTFFIYPEFRNFISNHDIDFAVYGTAYNYIKNLYSNRNTRWTKSFSSTVKHELFEDHHLAHAANAFYGSGFDSSYVLVVDRNGSFDTTTKKENIDKPDIFPCKFNTTDIEKNAPTGCQTETLYYCEYPDIFERVITNYSWMGITGKYAMISYHIGFTEMENGKTMGLSSYGKYVKDSYRVLNSSFPIYTFDHLKSIIGDSQVRKDFLISIDPSVSPEDLAKTIQVDTSKEIIDIINRINFEKTNNLCFTGGHAQNCMLNYEIAKTFKNVNLYVDPIPDDSGCSIGIAKYTWYNKTKSKNKSKLNDIFFMGDF